LQAGLSAGQDACPQGSMLPVLRLLSGPKCFLPAGATHCSDKGEIWHGGADRAKFHFYWGRNVGIPPKKLSKFGILPTIRPSGATRLHNFYETLSLCTHLQVAFTFLIWSLSGDKQPSYKHFPAVEAFSHKFSIARQNY